MSSVGDDVSLLLSEGSRGSNPGGPQDKKESVKVEKENVRVESKSEDFSTSPLHRHLVGDPRGLRNVAPPHPLRKTGPQVCRR